MLTALAAELPDIRSFWIVGLIAFAAGSLILKKLWPVATPKHDLKDYDGYIDALLTTNGARVRRDRQH